MHGIRLRERVTCTHYHHCTGIGHHENNLPLCRGSTDSGGQSASQANVPITLFIRDICCLRPGVPGYTDNITIKSLVGRYLEHSRVFVFGKYTRSRMFIGSGDLLNRNTNRRIEVFAEVRTDTTCRQLDFILSVLLADTWQMRSDGSYEHCQKESTRIDSHPILQKQFTPPQVPE